MGMVLLNKGFRVNINTKNDVERQNKTYKRIYFKIYHGSSLAGMLSILTVEYFPGQYGR